MEDSQDVLICGEAIDGKITTITKELVNIGRELSENLNQPLRLLLIGQSLQGVAAEAASLGSDVYLVDDVPFAESVPERYVAITAEVCQKATPSVIIFGQTDMGREVAPRVAARLKADVCMDCVDLAVEPETSSLLLTKPVYGGNAMAVWVSSEHKPQIITIRPRTASPAEPDSSRKGEIIPLTIKVDSSVFKSKLQESVREEVRGVKLEEAKVVVSGGGGIGGKEGFELLEGLAQILGGALGISRVPCDEGWMPSNLEIGQTGHVVSPDLYIAIGISGAPQHLAGCSGSKCIVAINKNPEAHIFKEADFGIIEDYRQALPPFIEKIKTLKS
ncbi:MAG: electron transfer flavoprotein subunit alpha/FixB family protein [Candidatus Aminicenantes bacterium]|nr:MAG: electron transfer flavoprotein subunit alpha/FixB family protein [Candidatus Aminicenantes bacterium]